MKTLKERFEEVKDDPTVRNSKECEVVEEKIRKKKEIPFSTKEAFILAVADPEQSPEDIVEKFFKEDTSEEVRKLVVKEITELRKNRAESLRALRELHDLRKKAERLN